jgi:hypothetical protein
MPIHARPLRAILMSLSLGLVPLAGCNKLITAITETAQTAAEEKTGGLTGGAKTEDDRLSEKLDAYIKCVNNQSNNVTDSGNRYFQWADAKEGPTGKGNVYGLYEIRDIKPCVDGVTAAANLDPDDTELEAAGKAYVDALVAAEAIGNEAYKYYDEKNYEDDKYAKAKEMHPKLVAAFETFAVADKAMRAAVSTRNEALQERDLARIETDMGKILMWHHKKTMSLAKKLMDTGDVPIEPEFALDLTKFEAALTEFETQVDAMNAYAKDHKEETDSLSGFSSVQSDADELKKASKEMLRRKRDNKAFTKDDFERFATGPAEWVEGSPAKLSHEYNELVNTSNRLNYQWYKAPPKP